MNHLCERELLEADAPPHSAPVGWRWLRRAVACTEVASASVISMSSLLDGETLGIAEHGVIADADTHAHGYGLE